MEPDLSRDISQALRIVWQILGVACGIVIIAPLVFPASVLLGWFPACATKTSGGRCVLCGMTTAFIHIGSGDWPEALSANTGSIALYAGLTLNFVIAVAYTMMRVIRHANS
ncbi:MAG TPA: DUF2752 domain-containing protein [Bryobacteraceae bacterium]|nr:DUF2752 domain-containing protein [Bryobacteraceae bacterium]